MHSTAQLRPLLTISFASSPSNLNSHVQINYQQRRVARLATWSLSPDRHPETTVQEMPTSPLHSNPHY